MGVPEEGQAWGEGVDVHAGRDRRFHVGDAVGQREGDLLDRRRSRLADVVARNRDRVPVRQVGSAVREGVDDQPHRGPGWVDVRPPGDVLLQDVVLNGAADLLPRDALLLRHQFVEEQQDGTRGVDGHGGGDLVHRQVGHEEPHVGQRVDGHTHLAHFTLRPRVVRVVAHLGRKVEGTREAGLSGVEQELEPLVGGFGRTEAGVLAHRPELRAVHLGVHAPGVGEGSGLTQLRCGIPAGEILCPVNRLDLDSRIRPMLLAVLHLGRHTYEPTRPRKYGSQGHGRGLQTQPRRRPGPTTYPATPLVEFGACRSVRAFRWWSCWPASCSGASCPRHS